MELGSQAPVNDQSSSSSFIMATDERQVKIEEEIVQMLEGKIQGQFTTLTARSIRIGTYKSVNKEKLVFVDKAIRIIVPSIHDREIKFFSLGNIFLDLFHH